MERHTTKQSAAQAPQDDAAMSVRATDSGSIKITREIPLPWLIGVIVGLLIQAVAVILTTQAQGQAIRDLAGEVRELRNAALTGSLKVVEHDVRLSDHERRITTLESSRGRAP